MEKETRETANERREVLQPLLRVFLFGEFRLAWQIAPFTQDALWNSRTSARTLFKLLLCAPGRQASCSQLTGILWPETDEAKARESLRQARNVLRKMLRTATGEELLEQRNQGESLKLAEQARLWVDADAFEDYIAQASGVAAADGALHLLQQAQALLTGEILTDDQSAEWTRHRWVRQRRQALWLARSRMVRYLADLYLQRGQHSLAEEVLEQHLARFPTDQDTLYRLLELLEEQRCFEQASILYERSRRILEAQGKKVAQHVRLFYEHFQQELSSRTQRPATGTGRAVVARRTSLTLSSERLHGLEKGRAGTVGQMLSLLGTDLSQGTSIDVLRALVEPEKEGSQDMAQLSRRQLLELGIAALISRLAQLDNKRISVAEREVLSRALSESVATSWKLFHRAGNAEVLAVGQAQLALLHQAHALVYPASLPYLYTGTYGLIGIALHFQERDEQALQTYHQGYLAALAAGDSWYVAQNLICQADSYHALRRYGMAIQTIEEALRVIARSTSQDATIARARAHLLSCWADNAMMLHDERTTQEKLDLAQSYLDPGLPNEEFDRAAWLLIAGKYALNTRDDMAAKNCFEEALRELPEGWLLRHAMSATGLAMAYARLGERDASLTVARDLVAPIQLIDAPMTNRWFTDYLRRDLLGVFPKDREVQGFVANTCQQLPQQTGLLRSDL